MTRVYCSCFHNGQTLAAILKRHRTALSCVQTKGIIAFMETDRSDCRLAVYGSLAPGKSNHHHLADIPGEWSDGWVEGELMDRGWGAGMGFPGIVLRPGGPRVPVQVLESDHLHDHWERLDAFEGDQYLRQLVQVHRDDGGPENPEEPGKPGGPVIANIYGLKDGGRD